MPGRPPTTRRPARRAALGLLLGSAALVGALALAAVLALDDQPQVVASAQVSPDDVARGMAVLKANDPRRAPEGALRAAALTAADIELGLNHGAQRLLGAAVAVRFDTDVAHLQASTRLPLGRWLNIDARLVAADGRPRLESVRLGHLPVPATAVELALPWIARGVPGGAEALEAASMIQGVWFFPGQVRVLYSWDRAAGKRVLASLVTPDEQGRLRAYQEWLTSLAARRSGAGAVPLGSVLPELFALAAARSEADADAAAEHRAALLAVTVWAVGQPLAQIVPAARDWPQPQALRVTLSGREDFALHFLVSAMLAADTSSPLSRAVGIYKEAADARGGSGFSFNDIAADRAGTRFGELALARPRELQQRLAAAGGHVDEAALMPPWRDLPEFLPEPEFVRRFGGVGAPEYQRLLAEIDRRIAALPLLR